jgi:hypothetical protein
MEHTKYCSWWKILLVPMKINENDYAEMQTLHHGNGKKKKETK